eukprot:CAMPEP_0178880604 /NCGR_PEP_ID=MMETSP0747-20121128/12554_1 /TAXON_ID=913974 /ORGANISM="Nitzschia punctata, Strain CCMP561" /LENGTH=175 /DNA_ID=CAMNT_0020548513 /DNA_START=15 /DNA_END=539 /DNA_ORIENTATION=+
MKLSLNYFLLVLAPLVSGQDPTESCPASIQNQTSCTAACQGGTNNDPAAADFVILSRAFGDGMGFDYIGFNCECAAADPSVFCMYDYSFPTCQEAGVPDCETSSNCGDLCTSLGLGGPTCIRNEAVEPAWTACQCETSFLDVDDKPQTMIYVCGDPGYDQPDSMSGARAAFVPRW